MTIRCGDSIIAGNSADIPSQTGQSGKFLTTNGTTTSWGEVKQIEIAQDLSTPSTDTVPSTKAVADESSRITSIMNNKVNKSGDTMTGNLTIKRNSAAELALRNESRDSAVNPEAWGAFGVMTFHDKNDVLTGLVENWQFDDGKIHMLMRALNRGKSAQIVVGVRADGTIYTECPTPTVSDNSNQIATTAYVNNKFQVVSALPASPDPNTYYFIPE